VLTSIQKNQLAQALIAAFTQDELERLLLLRLNLILDQIVDTLDSSYVDIVHGIITTAEQKGWIIELIREACRESPTNLELQSFIHRYPEYAPHNSAMTPTVRPLRVFLCHSSGDKQAVRLLYNQLREDGFEPWLDEQNLLAGQDWHHEIIKAVRDSDIVVVCLSNRSITTAGYVQREIKLALDVADQQPENTIFIIPLRLEECEVPERLSRWHWVNFYEENGYERLKRALQRRASALGSVKSFPSTTKETNEAPSQDGLPVNEGRGPSSTKRPLHEVNLSLKQQAGDLHVKGKKKWVLSSRGQGLGAAIIAAIATIVVGYWQFVYKPAQSSSAETGTYTGRVIDANTQRVIQGAKVSIESKGVPQVYYTDSEGVFYLKLHEPPEIIRIRVEASNYRVFERNTSLSRSAIEDIRLVPADAPSYTPTPTPTPTATPKKSTAGEASKRRSVLNKTVDPALDILTGKKR
jgi:hypothetical protein